MARNNPPMTPQERGRLAMRSRWGPQRILRLDELDPVTREIVTAIVDARANATAAKPDGKD